MTAPSRVHVSLPVIHHTQPVPGLPDKLASRIERAEARLRELGFQDNGTTWVLPAFSHEAVSMLSRHAMADRCNVAANSGDSVAMMRALGEAVAWLRTQP